MSEYRQNARQADEVKIKRSWRSCLPKVRLRMLHALIAWTVVGPFLGAYAIASFPDPFNGAALLTLGGLTIVILIATVAEVSE